MAPWGGVGLGHISPHNGTIAQWIIYASSVVFVGFRIFVRWHIQHALSASDVFLILSLAFCSISNAHDIADNEAYGTEDIQIQIHVLKTFYAGIPAWLTSIWCVKASFLLFYYKLFPPPPKGIKERFRSKKGLLRLLLDFTSFLCIVGWSVLMGGCFFTCRPIRRNWDIPAGDMCLSIGQYWVNVSIGFFHLFSDLLIYTLPFLLIFWVRIISHKQKKTVMIMFSLGFVNIVIAVLRYTFANLGTYDTRLLALFASLEMGVAVIIACLPSIRIFWRHWKRRQSMFLTIREMDVSDPVRENKIAHEWGTYVRSSSQPSQGLTLDSQPDELGGRTMMSQDHELRSVLVEDAGNISDKDVTGVVRTESGNTLSESSNRLGEIKAHDK